MSAPGAVGASKPGDAHAQGIADQVRSDVEKKAGKSLSQYKVVEYATQIVAGTNYFLKIDAGDEHVHARVFVGLGGAAPTVHSVQTGKSAHDKLAYF
eukprot:EC722292.1.p1 GENE.EC722292.1~~EC722292.1.p1  ORF type:complete len:107 (+),score=27.64 EC722292.1:31-321(+)